MDAKCSHGVGRTAPSGALVLAAALSALPGAAPAAGQDPGHADGLFCPGTRGALRSFQWARELEATGYLTKEREAQQGRKRARKPGEKFRDCPQCPEMVVVPAGSFRMGSPSEGADPLGVRDSIGPLHEVPAHEVTIGRPFAVGVYEVTRGEFAQFVSETGHSMGDSCWTIEGGEWEERSGRSWKSPGFFQTDAHPVVCVNWNDAQAYVQWLSRKTGEAYRLPSESEWEYVARAGTTTRYWWGNGLVEGWANCNECGSRWDGKRTAPVGSFPANPFGLYDVHGNVRERVEDCWNGSYHGAPRDGSAWRSGDCRMKMVRDGSWFNSRWTLRSAYRMPVTAGDRNYFDGFRIARTLTP